MGIPSYFSYIIKNHANIIRNLQYHRQRLRTRFDSMYLDCNSIIYDAVRSLQQGAQGSDAAKKAGHEVPLQPPRTPPCLPLQQGVKAAELPRELDTKCPCQGSDAAKRSGHEVPLQPPEPNSLSLLSTLEDRLVASVIERIWHCIRLIGPTQTVYIAFDGVAPLAKMEQQRTRRYKTGFMAALRFEDPQTPFASCNNEKGGAQGGGFDTTAITPGTDFMRLLTAGVHRAFDHAASAIGCRSVVVSGADEPGEGEHKMFAHMREHTVPDETVVVYGLDADLIMLSLFHVFAFENVFIFREQPEFAKSLGLETVGDGHDPLAAFLLLDGRGLAKAIVSEMGITATTIDSMRQRIYDYIFMCFFLGNDFLPHFPGLNIRTHGIFTLMEIYKRCIGHSETRFFIDMHTGRIQWHWVKRLVSGLAHQELGAIRHEYEARKKWETRSYSMKTEEDRRNAFENVPTLYRAQEHYICPFEPGWETRYYHAAFGSEASPSGLNDDHGRAPPTIAQICTNYLEGLEWVFRYYTAGCPDWKWRYEHHYPPLFSDLVPHIPDFETDFLSPLSSSLSTNRPFHPFTQLLYVVPRWNHGLLPLPCRRIANKIDGFYVDRNQLQFQWMYCKYFWESHAVLPAMRVQDMELIDMMFWTAET